MLFLQLGNLMPSSRRSMPIPKPWKLTFPRLKCPHCKRIITVAFFGRYRLSYSKRLNEAVSVRRAKDGSEESG